MTWLLVVAALLGPARATPENLPEPASVLVLHSSADIPYRTAFDPSLESTLRSAAGSPLSVYTEALDDSRFPGPSHEQLVLDYLRQKYAGRTIDVVIAVWDPALTFLLRHRAELFADVPIVALASRVDPSVQTANVTVVEADFRFRQSAELALGLHPSAQHLFVIEGAPENHGRVSKQIHAELQELEQRVSVSYLSDRPLDTVIARVKTMPDTSIILWVRQMIREADENIDPLHGLSAILQVSRVPVYGAAEGLVGHGIVGVYGHRMPTAANDVARIALRIARGERTEDIPWVKSTPVPTFDGRQLRRWGISGDHLPQGSVVLFATPTLWEHYKWYIAAAVTLIVAQTALISWLLVLRSARRRAEKALSASEERYRGVVEAQSELICRYLPDTTLTFVNDAYCRFWQKTRDELIGRPFVELIPESARDAARTHVASLITRPRIELDEHEVLLPDGGVGWQQWIDQVVLDAQGRVVEIQGIGRDVTEQRRAQESLRKSEAELRASYERTQALAGRLLVAQEAERTRIARELHDGVTQNLAAMALDLSRLKRDVPRSLRDAVRLLQQQAGAMASDVRHLSHDLHPAVLRQAGLVSALKGHCDQFARQHDIDVDLVAASDVGPIEPDTALCLFRVAQEALHNVVRHARARHAKVILTRAADMLELAVVDDGRGFDHTKARARDGLGLVSIDERVRLINGRMTISSRPGHGTTLRVELPGRVQPGSSGSVSIH